MNELLEQLTQRDLVWPAAKQFAAYNRVSSQLAELDAYLSGGWPEKGVVDVHADGISGELTLLLKPCVNESRTIVLINPPFTPCAQGLYQQGINLTQVIQVKTKDHAQALWSCEESLRSGSCSIVIAWLTRMSIAQVKRLQLACEHGNSRLFIVRQRQLGQSNWHLPVPLAVSISATHDGIKFTTLKQKGALAKQPILIRHHQLWPSLEQTHSMHNVVPFPTQVAL